VVEKHTPAIVRGNYLVKGVILNTSLELIINIEKECLKMFRNSVFKTIVLALVLLVSISITARAEGITPSVAAGTDFSVALKKDGTVWAWGKNNYGQLGDDTTISRSTPAQVLNLTNVVAIAAGYNHGLALKNDGTVWAWGNNSSGQLGDDTYIQRKIPVQVLNLTNVKAIQTGYYYSLALKTDGTVWGWGSNGSGQLGDNTGISSKLPVQTATLTGIVAISAGYDHAIAIKWDGTAWSWGFNYSGQVGDGTSMNNRLAPVQVQGLSEVVAVAAGMDHSVALKGNGTVYSWGLNTYGQLGDGTYNQKLLAQQIPGLNNVKQVIAGWQHNVVFKNDRTVWSWGRNNNGQLGDSTSNTRTSPVRVKNISDLVAISGGEDHTLAVKPDGSLRSWGQNDVGQLGIAAGGSQYIPVFIPGLNLGFTFQTAVSAGGYHSLALKSLGTVWGWGDNNWGQLGDDTSIERHTPVNTLNLSDTVAISAGFTHSMALKSDGTIWSWGRNTYGQLGHHPYVNQDLPSQVPDLNGIFAIATGSYHSLALKSDGTVWAWGYNNYGQLGNSDQGTYSSTPRQTLNLTNVVAIAGGQYHSLALKADGTVWAWGYNYYGQLGNNTWDNSQNPVQVFNLTDVVAIAAGGTHSMAIKTDGTVWTWGSNSDGKLGNNNPGVNSNVPVQANGLTEAIAIDGGQDFSLALKANGTLWTWGTNGYGQLGDNTYVRKTVPTQLITPTDVISISGGYTYTLALKSDGKIWSWGNNIYGALGDDTVITRPYPVNVKNLNLGIVVNPKVGASCFSTFVLKKNGTVWAWGHNQYGDLGINTWQDRYKLPVQTLLLTDVISIVPGTYHALALKSDGTVWAWGNNQYGQLGQGPGDFQDRRFPVQVPGLTNVVTISTGFYHSMAIKADGTTWIWGRNDTGQLGDNTSTNNPTPTMLNLDNVVDIAGGFFHTLAVKADGSVWTWGLNDYGQLGDGTYNSHYIPVQIPGINNVKKVAGGYSFSLTINNDGTVSAWGSNDSGQLGNNTYVWARNTPGPVSNISQIIDVSGGYYYCQALKSDGTVWVWGSNYYYQCDGSGRTNLRVPEQVPGLFATASDTGAQHSVIVKADGTVWTWGCNYWGGLGDDTLDNKPPQINTLNINLLFD
jgi:alpha-tubulin suppressor-like RCC1 family protein